MIDSRDINLLHPILKVIVEEYLSIAKKMGINVAVVSTYRDIECQNYYLKVTKTTTVPGGYSYHQHKIAVDIVPKNSAGAPYWPSINDPVWAKLGLIGESLGLEWGGRWTSFIDKPHYQMTFGLTCSQIMKGSVIPNVIKKGCTDVNLVKYVQRLLGVKPDGIFGDATKEAVKEHNTSGEVTAATLKKLIDISNQPPKEVKMMAEFADVPADHWSAKAMKHLHDLGLLNGYEENGKTVVGLGKAMTTERVVQLMSNVIRHVEENK